MSDPSPDNKYGMNIISIMKGDFMKTCLMILSAFALASASVAHATQITCDSSGANGLHGFFVYDDGPGGMDALHLQYGGKSYRDSVSDDQKFKFVEANVDDEGEGYGDILIVTGKDGVTFVFRNLANPSKKASVSVTQNGVLRDFALQCSAVAG